MLKFFYIVILITITIYTKVANGWNGYSNSNFENDCGPFGFTCERSNRVRLCEGTKSIGPAFLCPRGTFCNEESTNVCEDAINYIDPALTKKLRCNRNERIANPNVAGCKGYILCVLNGNRFQHINFQCSGNTIFNKLTRSCTSAIKYKCPVVNVTKPEQPELYENRNVHRPLSIECKNYKFRVTQSETPSRATYFCPPRPVRGQDAIWCTIFSNDFCVTLEKDTEDQYVPDGTPYRRPRM